MDFAFSDCPGDRPNIFLSFWAMSSLRSDSRLFNTWLGSTVFVTGGPNGNSLAGAAGGGAWAQQMVEKSVAARRNSAFGDMTSPG